MNNTLYLVAGARPNFMKIAPVLHAIQARQAQGSKLRYRLVHLRETNVGDERAAQIRRQTDQAVGKVRAGYAARAAQAPQKK